MTRRNIIELARGWYKPENYNCVTGYSAKEYAHALFVRHELIEVIGEHGSVISALAPVYESIINGDLEPPSWMRPWSLIDEVACPISCVEILQMAEKLRAGGWKRDYDREAQARNKGEISVRIGENVPVRSMKWKGGTTFDGKAVDDNTFYDEYIWEFGCWPSERFPNMFRSEFSIKIDLLASDEDILNRIKRLLPEIRKMKNLPAYNPKTKDGRSLGRQHTWLESAKNDRILDVIDLQIWAKVNDIRLGNSHIAKLVYSDRDEGGSESSVAKTYLPKVEQALDDRRIMALWLTGES